MSVPTRPPYWDQATRELTDRDPVMGALIARYPEVFLSTRGNSFTTLLRSIVGQQISVKAAQSIWNRLAAAADCETPKNFLKAKEPTLRACGLSQRKAEYVRDLAQHFTRGDLDPATWTHKSDEEIITELSAVRGIGRWTAEMFLIFHLLRPDVYPVDDIGLQRAVSNLFKKRYPPSRATLQKVAVKWKPWRSVATWYLWRSLDPLPVAY